MSDACMTAPASSGFLYPTVVLDLRSIPHHVTSMHAHRAEAKGVSAKRIRKRARSPGEIGRLRLGACAALQAFHYPAIFVPIRPGGCDIVLDHEGFHA